MELEAQVNLLLLADLVVLLAVLATAVGPLLRELSLLRQTIRAALHRLRTTRAARRQLALETELERQVQLAEMVRVPPLQPQMARVARLRPRLLLQLRQARAMTMF